MMFNNKGIDQSCHNGNINVSEKYSVLWKMLIIKH